MSRRPRVGGLGAVQHSKGSFLVLISGSFPAAQGDYSFIRHEIDELAERFDRVLIFSFRRVETPMVTLPPNVMYVGALRDTRKIDGLIALFRPSRLWAALSAVKSEARSGRIRGHIPLVLGNIFTGQRFALSIDRALRRARASKDSQVSVYSFWGSHGAMALPFLSSRFHRVVRLHRFDLYEGVGGRLPLRASIFGSVDALLSISEDGEEYLKENFAHMIPDGTLSVVRLGTEDHGLGPMPKLLINRDEREPIQVVSCSSVIDVKRVEAIIPALEVLAGEHPVYWTHFGSGERMAQLASDSRAANRRTTRLEIDLRGQTDNNDVLAHYRDFPVDVFVNVSDSEGVPVSIMEAQSFGIPVVATDVGGTREIVGAHLRSGILLSPRPTAVDLSDSILSVVHARQSLDPRAVWQQRSDARVSAAQIADLVAATSETAAL